MNVKDWRKLTTCNCIFSKSNKYLLSAHVLKSMLEAVEVSKVGLQIVTFFEPHE